MQKARKQRLLGSIVAAAVAAITLAGCADPGTEAPAGGVAIDVGNGEITPKNVDSFAVMLQAGPTYSDSANKADGAEAAGKALGADVEVFYSNLDPATEQQNWNTIVNSGEYGGILIQPVAPQMCKLIADAAAQERLLVVVVGSPLCGDGSEEGADLRSPGTIAYVSGNNLLDAARPLFDDAAEILGDGPQKVLLVYGNEGYPTVVAHEIAWEEFSAEHPDWENVGQVYTNWTTPDAFAQTQNLLQANSDATVVFSAYADITAGVARAVEDAGLTDQVSLFESSGGSQLSVDLINSGQLEGSLPIYSYDQAYLGVETLYDAARGTQPEPFLRLPKLDETGMITPKTVDSYSER